MSNHIETSVDIINTISRLIPEIKEDCHIRAIITKENRIRVFLSREEDDKSKIYDYYPQTKEMKVTDWFNYELSKF